MLASYFAAERRRAHHWQNVAGRVIIPEHSYGGNEKWKNFVDSPAALKALFGGNRSGKTHQNVYRQVQKLRARPGLIAWAAINTSDMLGETLWPKYKEFLHPSEYYEPAWANKRKGIPSFVQLRNGSQLWFKTYAQGRQVFQSASVDDILLSEEPEDPQIIIESIARTGDRGGQVCLDMTPLFGKTWPYFHIDQANKPGVVESWRCSLFENPFVEEAYKQTLLSLYGADEIDRRIYGLFTILEGAILKEWDDTVHVLHDFPVMPSTWPHIRSIDLGARNPFVCGWYALAPDGILYKYDEYYNPNKERNTTIETHADNIRAREEQHIADGRVILREGRYYITTTICDWELQTRIELEKHGIVTEPATKQKKLSWELANRILKQRPASFQVAPWCINTLREIPNYHYKRVRVGAEIREEESKVDDHTVDETLYAMMHFFGAENWDPNGIISG